MLNRLKRTVAQLAGWGFWFPDIAATCKARGVTLIEDRHWAGFAGEHRAGIEELPGHILVLYPGAWRFRCALARVPTEVNTPESQLPHTSNPELMAKTGLGWSWLWEGYNLKEFVAAVESAKN